ncbi:MAG: hypothetical protein RI535_07960 [Psychroflexus sp.]|jgi:hypothetical protein|nr:hypothetical protein [Psychroflexus sp.]
MKKVISIIIILLLISTTNVDAQCAMCRAALESNTDNGAAEAINDGIVYLMAFPYLLMGGLGYFIYRKFRKKSNLQANS